MDDSFFGFNSSLPVSKLPQDHFPSKIPGLGAQKRQQIDFQNSSRISITTFPLHISVIRLSFIGFLIIPFLPSATFHFATI